MKRAYLVFIGVILSCLVFAGEEDTCQTVAAAARTPEEMWASTGLRYSVLKEILDNEASRTSEEDFLAAVASINMLLASLETPLLAVPFDFGSSDLPNSSFVKRFGDVHIVHPEGEWAPAKVQEILRDQWKRVYAKKAPVDFQEILAWTLPKCDRARESFLVGRAINAGLYEKDSHSRILPWEMVRSEEAAPGISFAGIGIQVVEGDEHTLIAGIIPGGSAEKAGLRARDRIMAIDGVPTKDIKKGDVTSRISGKPGDRVRLTIGRGDKAHEVEVERKEMVSPHALTREIRIEGNKVGYIQVSDFSSHPLIEQTTRAIREFEKNGVKGLILDLRFNPGGEEAIAQKFLGIFMGPNRHMMTELDLSSGTSTPIYTLGEKVTDLPLTVIVNGRSASAAEVVSGTLQQTGRAYVVGERTYGKGTVQGAVDLEQSPLFRGKNLLLYRTRAVYFIPPGRSPQVYGVPPDFVARRNPLATQDMNFGREEDAFDVFPNPGLPLEVPQREKSREIRQCLAQNGRATQAYYSTRPTESGRDFQLLVAQDVLRCLFML